MTVDRLIRIFAGTFIILSLALGVEGSPLFINKWWLAFTAFVGSICFNSALPMSARWAGSSRNSASLKSPPAIPRKDSQNECTR